MDEFINKNYNNHVGALLGVSKGSDYGKACGNDVTGGTNNYGPHYALNETEWYHAATGQRRDSTITTENVLAKVEFDAGGWTCRTVANTSVTASPENRALPARNHEDSMISESAKHVESAMGGFNALKNSQKVGSTTYTSSAGDTMLLQWFYVDELEYDGFKPLIVVVIPENDYLASITEVRLPAHPPVHRSRMSNQNIAEKLPVPCRQTPRRPPASRKPATRLWLWSSCPSWSRWSCRWRSPSLSQSRSTT